MENRERWMNFIYIDADFLFMLINLNMMINLKYISDEV